MNRTRTSSGKWTKIINTQGIRLRRNIPTFNTKSKQSVFQSQLIILENQHFLIVPPTWLIQHTIPNIHQTGRSQKLLWRLWKLAKCGRKKLANDKKLSGGTIASALIRGSANMKHGTFESGRAIINKWPIVKQTRRIGSGHVYAVGSDGKSLETT